MVLLQNIWWLLVLIGVMILIHELGHYWAARFFDVRVEVFSFGFGPRLFGFRRGETDFRFAAILFGGYVKMSGEQPGDDTTSDPRAFSSKTRWQRLIIAFAGPAMNIVLAVALLAGLFLVRFPKVANADEPPVIGFVEKDSPAADAGLREADEIVQIDDMVHPKWKDIHLKIAGSARKPVMIAVRRDGERIHTSITPEADEKLGIGNVGWDERHDVQVSGVLSGMDAERAGLQRGDIVVAANGQPVRSTAKLHEILRRSDGRPVQVLFSRNGRQQTVTVQPSFSKMDSNSGRWMLGVQLEPRVVFVKLPLPEAIRESVQQNIDNATLIYQFLRGMIERRLSPKSLEGPIRIAQLSGEAAREGPIAFIGLMALVSLNLAIFNLLPIPVLDGGLILMLLVEMVMRRDLSMPVKEAVIKVGMVFLMAVVVFVLYNDISKILPG
ncbi:MAG: RIP metalloprotease RseP [Acidobacteria bacterium]|nr:RIP metalloprotease RseP [Acidobacteriota bacterium]